MWGVQAGTNKQSRLTDPEIAQRRSIRGRRCRNRFKRPRGKIKLRVASDSVNRIQLPSGDKLSGDSANASVTKNISRNCILMSPRGSASVTVVDTQSHQVSTTLAPVIQGVCNCAETLLLAIRTILRTQKGENPKFIFSEVQKLAVGQNLHFPRP